MKIGAQGWRGLLPAHLKTIMGCGLKLSSQMQMQLDPIPLPMPRNPGKLCPAASYSCSYMVETFAAGCRRSEPRAWDPKAREGKHAGVCAREGGTQEMKKSRQEGESRRKWRKS